MSSMSTTPPRRQAQNHPTGAQIRAARGLLNMSVAELAELTGLAVNTIKRAEATNGAAPITAANAALIVMRLEEAGVELIAPGEVAGAGARFAAAEHEQEAYRRRRRRST